jgi:hypothetical protein
MAVRILLVVAVSIVFCGCSQPAAPPEQAEKEGVEEAVEETPDGEKIQKEVSVPPDVPAYTLTKDEMGMVGSFDARVVSASTDVTSGEDLEAITRELWADTTRADTMQVVFYPNEPTAETTGSGMAFLSEAAARATFQEISARGADPNAIEAKRWYLRDPHSGDSRQLDRRRMRQVGYDHDGDTTPGVGLSRVLTHSPGPMSMAVLAA